MYLTQVLNTELVIHAIKNMGYLIISIFKMMLYIGLLLLVGIHNLVTYCVVIYARISMNRWDYAIQILVALYLFAAIIFNIVSYFSQINRKIEEEFERKLQKIYLLGEDNYYRLNEIERKITKGIVKNK
jgi:uncharacterized membrane protein YqjE